jgi:hypothetical protein
MSAFDPKRTSAHTSISWRTGAPTFYIWINSRSSRTIYYQRRIGILKRGTQQSYEIKRRRLERL